MKKTVRVLALALWLPTVMALAQTPAPGSAPESAAKPPSKHEEQALKWFHQLDVNHDGCVTKAEAAPLFLFKPSLRQWFDDADTNHDGCLTEDEVRAKSAKDRAAKAARKAKEAAAKAAAEKAAQ